MNRIFPLTLAVSAALLTACGGSSGSSNNTPSDITDPVVDESGYTVIITQAVYGSGSEVALADAGNLADITDGYYADVATDYFTASYDGFYWYIGREGIDTISKYDPEMPNANYYGNNGYSLLDNEQSSSSNVHSMAFVSSDRAILTRYGQNTAWIVNPEAQNQSDFKVGELDLNAYHAADDTVTPYPEMDDIALYDGKAFITMQRLGNDQEGGGYAYARAPYLAVFDTDSYAEIDTDEEAAGLNGIELDITNPINIATDGSNLYVQGITYDSSYTGGLVKIDMDTYAQETVFDPALTSTSISDVAIAGDKIFVVVYHGWQNNDLAVVNSDGSLTTVAGFTGINIGFITSGPDGDLWLGRGDDGSNSAALLHISPVDYAVVDSVNTNLDPIGISFVDNQL